jgi:hypothetical protein
LRKDCLERQASDGTDIQNCYAVSSSDLFTSAPVLKHHRECKDRSDSSTNKDELPALDERPDDTDEKHSDNKELRGEGGDQSTNIISIFDGDLGQSLRQILVLVVLSVFALVIPSLARNLTLAGLVFEAGRILLEEV